MLSLISNSSRIETVSNLEPAPAPAQLKSSAHSEDRDFPGWLLLAILSLKVVALILLFQSGFGLIALGLCAMSMSVLIGEREDMRRMREASVADAIDAVAHQPAPHLEER